MTKTNLLRRLHEDEAGQDLLEYALVLATVLAAVVSGSDAIAKVIATGLTTLMGSVQNTIAK